MTANQKIMVGVVAQLFCAVRAEYTDAAFVPDPEGRWYKTASGTWIRGRESSDRGGFSLVSTDEECRLNTAINIYEKICSYAGVK